MIKRLLWITLLITLLGVWTTPLWAAELNELLAAIKVAASQTDTLSSDFVQEKNLSIMDEKLVSKGYFAFRKPDNLRWELLSVYCLWFCSAC